MIWNPFLAMLLWAVVVGIAICRAAGTAAGSNHLAHASTVLYPAASLQQDLHDADTLLPRQRGAAAAPLLYMQKETVGSNLSTHAIVTPSFAIPAVVLDNARNIRELKMLDPEQLLIAFSDEDAFQASHDAWMASDELLFVSYTPGCGGYEHGEHCYFRSHKLSWNRSSKEVTSFGAISSLSETAESVDVEFGISEPAAGERSRGTAGPHAANKIVGGMWSPPTQSFSFPPQSGYCFPSAQGCAYSNPGVVVVPSPWGQGDAILLGSFDHQGRLDAHNSINANLNYYCVECGVSGRMRLSGKFSIDVIRGRVNGYVQLDGDVKGSLKLGIRGYLTHTYALPVVTVYDAPLPGFSIPGIGKFGPSFKIATDLRATTTIGGKLLAGGDIDIPGISLRYDFVTSKATMGPLSTDLKPVVSVDGDATTHAEAALPVTFSVGLQLFNGTCPQCNVLLSAQVRPKVYANAHAARERTWASNSTSLAEPDPAACQGVAADLSYQAIVDLTADIQGQIYTQRLADTGSMMVVQKCFPLKSGRVKRAAVRSRSLMAHISS